MQLQRNLAVAGMGCHSTMRCANYCQYCSYPRMSHTKTDALWYFPIFFKTYQHEQN